MELRRSRINWRKPGPSLCKCAHALNSNKCPSTTAKKIREVCNFCQVSARKVSALWWSDGSGDELSLIWKSKLCDRVKKRTFPTTLCWCLHVMTLELGVQTLRWAGSSGVCSIGGATGRSARRTRQDNANFAPPSVRWLGRLGLRAMADGSRLAHRWITRLSAISGGGRVAWPVECLKTAHSQALCRSE